MCFRSSGEGRCANMVHSMHGDVCQLVSHLKSRRTHTLASTSKYVCSTVLACRQVSKVAQRCVIKRISLTILGRHHARRSYTIVRCQLPSHMQCLKQYGCHRLLHDIRSLTPRRRRVFAALSVPPTLQPKLMSVAVMLGASAAFISPFGYQCEC